MIHTTKHHQSYNFLNKITIYQKRNVIRGSTNSKEIQNLRKTIKKMI